MMWTSWESGRRDLIVNKYLEANKGYWDQAVYDAINPESFVFRTYGRIFVYDFGFDGSKGEKLLDFGCGSGGNLRFYKEKGFNVYGVDISKIDIDRCEERMPDIKDHFRIIHPKPHRDDRFFDVEYDVVVAIQSLYYLSNTDLEERLLSLYNQMKKGAIIFATTIGNENYYYQHSVEYKDGLRKVDFATKRLTVSDLYINFTASEEDLEEKFGMFERRHIGFYDYSYREDEGNEFHWTFVGQKV